MSIVMETINKFFDVFVNEGMKGNIVGPVLQLRLCRQLPIEDQVGGFQIGAPLSKLFNRVTTIAQDSLFSVDKSNLALARSCIHKGRVIGHDPEVIVGDLDLAQIRSPDGGTFGGIETIHQGNLVALVGSVIDHRERILGHTHLQFLRVTDPGVAKLTFVSILTKELRQFSTTQRSFRAWKKLES